MVSLISKVFAADTSSSVGTTIINPLSRFQNIGQIFSFVTNLLIGIGWGMVFIMLALGFWKYIMSKGEQKETQGAQSMLTYAVIGGVGLLALGLVRTLVAGVLGIAPADIDVGGGIVPGGVK